ncbi:MAG: hypothetical protein AAF565_12145 [Pseudomonadota bacterium]
MNRHALPLTLALTATAAPAQMAITLEREPGSQPICAVLQMPRDDGNAKTRVLFKIIERVWEIKMLKARLAENECRCRDQVEIDFLSVVEEADAAHDAYWSETDRAKREAVTMALGERQKELRIRFAKECGEG